MTRLHGVRAARIAAYSAFFILLALETARAHVVKIEIERKESPAWVVRGTEPPPSHSPRIDNGQLVKSTKAAMGFPTLPGGISPEGLQNPFYDYDFGSAFQYNDFSGVITQQPPKIRQVLPEIVPKVDADGNETSGIPSPLFQAPLGTYLGWNIATTGYYKGKICSLSGGYVPFAKTEAERLASGDPRLSIEERYASHDDYVARVKAAADQLVREQFLLQEDADRIVREAAASDVRR